MLRIVVPLLLSVTPALSAQDPATFPALARGPDGAVALPLGNADAGRWQPVGAGTAVRGTPAGLRVGYERAARAAFGAALAFRAGSLAGLHTLRLELTDATPATLLVSLRDADGGVWSWPMLRLDDGDHAFDLDVADVGPDRFQNGGREPGPFDPARAVILSVTDIAGYLGGRPGPVAWTLGAARGDCDGAATGGQRAPADGSAAEQAFFAALVDGAATADAVLPALLVDAMQRPDAGRPALLLGLTHLWTAAEGDRADPRQVEHLLLAEAWLERAAARDPGEDRLPSWLVPARVAIAAALGEDHADPALRAPLDAAAARDPGFHGFAVGLLGRDAPVGSAAFRTGLAALRATIDGADPADPSVRNEPHWPHNREGFLLFAADYERRAGATGRALELLDRIEAIDGFASWPFRAEVARRRAAWSNGDDLPPAEFATRRHGCALCHRAR